MKAIVGFEQYLNNIKLSGFDDFEKKYKRYNKSKKFKNIYSYSLNTMEKK